MYAMRTVQILVRTAIVLQRPFMPLTFIHVRHGLHRRWYSLACSEEESRKAIPVSEIVHLASKFAGELKCWFCDL